MSRITVANFIGRYGSRSIPDIADMLSRGKSQAEIVGILNRIHPIDETRLSRFLKDIIEWRALVREDVIEYLELFA